MAYTESPNLGQILAEGLPRRGDAGPKTVAVIGAGAAGLLCAQELARAGHTVIVYEARSQVGGRIRTLREGFAPGLYGEAGAHSIRDNHHMTTWLCDDLGLGRRPYIGRNDTDGVISYGEVVQMVKEVNTLPANDPFPVTGTEQVHTGAKLWYDATAKLRSVLERDGWGAIAEYTGDTTVRGYLERQAWSDAAIVKYAMSCGREHTLDESMTSVFTDQHLNATTRSSEIIGGMDLLPTALYHRLADRIVLNAQVTAVHQRTDEIVVVWTDRISGVERYSAHSHVVLALPLQPLRQITFTPELSRPKRQALRALSYQAATRTLIQYRSRFWEQPPYGCTAGGSSATDRPIRRVIYPTYKPETGERGILVASATWGDDARFWETIAPADRLRRTHRDIAFLHDKVKVDPETGFCVTWGDDPFAGGARLLYGPGDRERHLAALRRPEDRLHFAGEHLGEAHGTVEGAVESGVATAHAVHHSAP